MANSGSAPPVSISADSILAPDQEMPGSLRAPLTARKILVGQLLIVTGAASSLDTTESWAHRDLIIELNGVRLPSLRGRGGMSLGMRVESLGRDVGFVWPDDRAGLGVGSKLAEVRGIAEGLEDAAVVEEVRKIDVSGEVILEADMNNVALEGLGVDE